jgi:signal transduction histidine kinase
MKTIPSYKPKCLIVDDLSKGVIELQNVLKEEKLTIISASSGLEALDLLLQHHFAFVMIDVQRPGMDGFEFAEILRSTDSTSKIPIIFLIPAGHDIQINFQGFEKGAVDFLLRPLIPQLVVSKVRLFLELFTQRMLLDQKVEKIRETEAYLQKALRTRDEFLSICSHELKTPLTSLKMQIQITHRLKEKKGAEVAFSSENMDKFLIQADRSVERIIQLVNEMLDISRVATGRLKLNPEQVDLGQFTSEIVEKLKVYMELADCPVKLDVEKGVVGLWDKFRLEQVLTNLLTNTVKYAPQSEVEVTVRRDDKFAVLEVTDFGEGITDSDQKRIFDRFERAVSATSVSGLGLGLYISKEIIELHHGTIGVKSSVGKGSKFFVRLPLI